MRIALERPLSGCHVYLIFSVFIVKLAVMVIPDVRHQTVKLYLKVFHLHCVEFKIQCIKLCVYSHIHTVKTQQISQIVSLYNEQHYVIYNNYMFQPCKWAPHNTELLSYCNIYTHIYLFYILYIH
jgi:hypothetical protein